jgi:N-acetylmuramoyl-L-alanine amidase
LRTLTDDASDNRVSAHYVVAPNGTVYALVRDEDEAWHARDSNMESIGIEVVGHADDPGTWTPAVVASLGNLVGWLSSTYNLPLTYRARTADPPAGFVAHAALDPSRRGDPGPWFPWADVKAQAEREQGSRALWPLAIVGGLAAWLLLR